MKYRTDIDGLRALAVVAVILFHLGFLPNGYLGVDVFFVISGYLITSIVYGKSEARKFSIIDFYERRIRRIIPLLLVVTTLALLLGLVVMLPDDLENLGQSVVASNVSANNILMYFTSADYWSVRNDYKPLMHTWSLGIEEQFYLLYPFIFFALGGPRLKYVKYVLLTLSIASLAAFLWQEDESAKFYFIQYRFFELAAGGLGAILFRKSIFTHYGLGRYCLYGLLALTAAIMFLPVLATNESRVLATTGLSVALLVVGKQYFDTDKVYSWIMANPVMTFIGAISYSLYMWHQLIFAFARYTVVEEITPSWAAGLSALTLGLSVLTYYGVENTFRDRKRMRTRTVLLFTGGLFVLSTVAAFYVYSIGGVVRDYPELALYKDDPHRKLNLLSRSQNIHNAYNERVRDLNMDFSGNNKIKVLVVGNSFARDAANILLESEFGESMEVRYATGNFVVKPGGQALKRLQEAEVILIAAQGELSNTMLQEIDEAHGVKMDYGNTWVLGTKDFGNSNGIHYNRLTPEIDYRTYRTRMKSNVLPKNEWLRTEWGDRYIDLIAMLSTEEGEVLVFTPDGRFISQDTIHLTKSGAQYLASVLSDHIAAMLLVARKSDMETEIIQVGYE
ncbi:acyltransferase family protein [Lewinella sp. IMCC34191]|uniref:acyltransferase family protein n=1 Tax=Lewinella sp. IMCC34191 TaxID=2259172 RepID=UPI001300A7C4|nr:acyltransferase [Lewinella sp. IMCC34191]